MVVLAVVVDAVVLAVVDSSVNYIIDHYNDQFYEFRVLTLPLTHLLQDFALKIVILLC